MSIKSALTHPIIAGSLVLIAGVWFIFVAVKKVSKQLKNSYETPDTTIIYKNGRSDTMIIKKSAPSWLN